MAKKGFFVVFEGIDKCGKRTQLDMTRKWLHPNHAVVYGSEPNDLVSPLGKYIRALLQGKASLVPDSFALQRMFTLDRAQDVICFIRPALESGKIVLLERFFHSTLAYGANGDPRHEFACERAMERFWMMQKEIIGPFLILPDLTFIIDISGAETLKRLSSSARSAAEYFEKEKILEQARQNYLALSQRDDLGSMAVINGRRSQAEIFEEIKAILIEKFELQP